MSACGTPVPLKLQVALSEGTKEVEVPSGSTLHDIQRTAKRACPALKNVVRACTRQGRRLVLCVLTNSAVIAGTELCSPYSNVSHLDV